ncbi:MAG: M1 family metallopeptidase [Clostridia bacterium]|nr:M1 family metallopeptidase [Clostridia bacterium]
MKKLISILLIVCALSLCVSLSACDGKDRKCDRYEMFCIYDEETSTLSGTVDFTFYNHTENELSDLKFNLYGNAFREDAAYKPVSDAYKNRAYYAGESYGAMSIENVENCAGWNVAGEDENILVVNLLTPIYPEDTAVLKITYTLNLAKINHRTGVSENCINLGNFYPVLCAYSTEGFIEANYYTCGDPFISECADYSVTVDVPENYVIASSGKLTGESFANGRKKSSYVLEDARDFAMVLSDKFEVLSQTVDGVEVSYYYTSDANAQNSLNVATESLKYFSDTFGKYVYPTLSVVQTGFCYGGMEYPALTMIAEGLDRDNTAYTIVHENAHQWWYAMVGSDQLNDPWQDEGLTEYSTLLFFENHPNYGFTRKGIINSATSYYRAFFTVFSQLNDEADTRMHRHLSEYTSELEYNNVTYNKGLILFETLRNSVGDEKFFSGLKKYYEDNLLKIATADDLCACFIKGGTDVEGLFNSFLQGKILI